MNALPTAFGDDATVTRAAVQRAWSETPIARRLAVVRRVRRALAADPLGLAACVTAPSRRIADIVASEVLPLADACRHLECAAPSALSPRRLGRRGRPAWLSGCDAEIHHDPVGVVLVVGPRNYPAFLPGVAVLQALVAGNAVIVKPAPGAERPMQWLVARLVEAGCPAPLLTQLDADPRSIGAALEQGIDLAVLTGHADTGRALLGALAARLTPAILELSGCDAAIVLAGADPRLAADALAYGLRLNGGATCIAPRRLLVERPMLAPLLAALTTRLHGIAPVPIPTAVRDQVRGVIAAAEQGGYRVVGVPPSAEASVMAPILLIGEGAEGWRLDTDLFAPVLAVTPVDDPAAAVAVANASRHRLGASVFGPADAARRVAGQLHAGAVTINDLIVPTADPRLPFGGSGESGYGVTRGTEGLLAFTRIKTISQRRHGPWAHLAPPHAEDAALLAGYVGLAHGGGRTRWASLCVLVGALWRRALSGAA